MQQLQAALGAIVPRLTNPQSKFIRTTEGVAFAVFGAVLFVIPIFVAHETQAMSHNLALGKTIYIATVISRTGLKVVQVFKGAGLAPIDPAASNLPDPVKTGLSEIEAAEKAAQDIQQQVGTPAEQVEHGLAPSPTNTGTSNSVTAAVTPVIPEQGPGIREPDQPAPVNPAGVTTPPSS